jgi:hypothetical protein
MSLILRLFTGLSAALSAGLLTSLLLVGAGDGAAALLRWRRGPWAWEERVRRQPDDEAQEGEGRWARFAGAPVGLAGALLARDPLLSPWLLVWGTALGFWWASYRSRRQKQDASETAVRELVRLLRNYLRGSLVGALEKAAGRLEEGKVKEALARVVRDYNAGRTWQQVIAHLRGFGMEMDRLALLLAIAPTMPEGQILARLEELQAEMDVMASLEAELGGELILLTLTTRFLVAANLVAMTAALVLPAWRDFYTSTFGRRLTYVAATLLPALAFVYFSEELDSLKGYL